ncbi:hypothetical protein OZX74_01870 [Bifidobacterium sp. ESL0798]|uniref:hypothetical protein n=1 Tax=Bifidobacterium sp. ESL0798 TaxID=2983235 RepID=UPI0023F71AE1|nr:hypothetical protein [Bifidobacterium sp. ESL0798]WEV74326.1 hypothetical protein OZX74_01870 [Bifidobacterium sp. ESL0798]
MVPTIEHMEVVPVAGYDSMLLNLAGAHEPFFTRNVVVMTDSDGYTGVAEVPGGEVIAQRLELCVPLVEGKPISQWKGVVQDCEEMLKKSRKRSRIQRCPDRTRHDLQEAHQCVDRRRDADA